MDAFAMGILVSPVLGVSRWSIRAWPTPPTGAETILLLSHGLQDCIFLAPQSVTCAIRVCGGILCCRVVTGGRSSHPAFDHQWKGHGLPRDIACWKCLGKRWRVCCSEGCGPPPLSLRGQKAGSTRAFEMMSHRACPEIACNSD